MKSFDRIFDNNQVKIIQHSEQLPLNHITDVIVDNKFILDIGSA